MVLLFLKSFLNYLCTRNNSLLHLLHDLIFNFTCHRCVCNRLVRRNSALLQEWFQVVVCVIIVYLLLNFISVLFEFLSGLIIKSFVNGQYSVSYSFVLFRSSVFDLPYGLICLFFHFKQFLMFLLSYWVVIFLLVGINFSQA